MFDLTDRTVLVTGAGRGVGLGIARVLIDAGAHVYVNDLEYGLHADIMDWLEKNAPAYGVDGKDGPEYRHHRTGEDNGDAHLKRQLLGHQVTMPITDGRLHLGPWEQIHYAEFDGMRPKRILVKIVGVRG